MIDGYTVVKTEVNRKNHTRYLYVNGELVSSLILIDLDQWVGGSRIKSGGIGDVKTLEKHRNNGYMKILMNNTLEYMANNNFDASVLIGVPNFYNKYGYSSNIFRHNITIYSYLLDNLKTCASSINFREIKYNDCSTIVDLFNNNNKFRQCNIIRDKEDFYGFNRNYNPECEIFSFLVENSQGEILGYAVYEKSQTEFSLIEVEVIDKLLFFDIISKVKELAFSNPNITKLQILMPDDHPFVLFLNRFGYTVSTTIPNNELGMMRIVNLLSLFKKIIKGEMANRLKETYGYNSSKNWIIKTDISCISINLEKGNLSVNKCDKTKEPAIELPQKILIQLLTGFRSIEDILITRDPNVRCNDIEFANILNSGNKPYIWTADHF